MAVAVITTFNAYDGEGNSTSAADQATLVDQFSNITEVSSGQQLAVGSAPPPSATVLTRLRQISGVQGIVEVQG